MVQSSETRTPLANSSSNMATSRMAFLWALKDPGLYSSSYAAEKMAQEHDDQLFLARGFLGEYEAVFFQTGCTQGYPHKQGNGKTPLMLRFFF